MKILVTSPFPLDGKSGNAVTARRIAGLLPDARVCHGWDGESADLFIALHAHRSRHAVERFQAAHPQGRVAILLTGTDLNDFPLDELLQIGLKVDALVCMHDQALKRLPEPLLNRAHVIFPSVQMSPRKTSPEPHLVTLIGHLRPVKNPFLAVESLGDLPLRLIHIGKALEDEEERHAKRWHESESRYEWLGGLPRDRTLDWLSRSWVTLNTSHSEGASNVVAEAVVLGVPVFATRIEGNVGLLGPEHLGLFEPPELHAHMDRAFREPEFLDTIRLQQAKRRPLFSTAREATSWMSLAERVVESR